MKEAGKALHRNLQQFHQFPELPLDSVDVQSSFTIHHLRRVNTAVPYQSPAFRFNYFSFVFVKNAYGSYTTDEQYFDVQPGTIYFTNPGHYKSFAWNRLEDVYVVTLNETFLKKNVYDNIFDEFPFLLAETVPPKVMGTAVFAEFDNLCQLLFTEYAKDTPYCNQVIGNLFVVILLKIKSYFWQDYNPIYEGNRSSQIVKTFKQCLEQHFRSLSHNETPKAFRVQDYADAQHLHPSYLSNVIKIKTGKSTSTWIVEKTIAEAKAMLKNSSLSVSEISYRLGFTEANHFSNYFKKHASHSPVEFRKYQLPSTS